MNSALSGLNALAHEGRLEHFRLLVKAGAQGMAAGDIARAAGVNVTTSSAQLAILSDAGLLSTRREGRSVIYAANFPVISALMAFLIEDCCQANPQVCRPLAPIVERASCCDT